LGFLAYRHWAVTFFVENGVLSAQRNVFDERDAIKLKAVVALHFKPAN
jgi:hypothetical protein